MESILDLTATATFPFLALPCELRLQVYKQLFSSAEKKVLHSASIEWEENGEMRLYRQRKLQRSIEQTAKVEGILLASKMIHNEARPVLFQHGKLELNLLSDLSKEIFGNTTVVRPAAVEHRLANLKDHLLTFRHLYLPAPVIYQLESNDQVDEAFAIAKAILKQFAAARPGLRALHMDLTAFMHPIRAFEAGSVDNTGARLAGYFIAKLPIFKVATFTFSKGKPKTNQIGYDRNMTTVDHAGLVEEITGICAAKELVPVMDDVEQN